MEFGIPIQEYGRRDDARHAKKRSNILNLEASKCEGWAGQGLS